MKATALPFPWRANAIALAMGVAIIGLAAVRAHSETVSPFSPPPAATQPTQQAAAPDFACHASAGDWCDLRDWSGFAKAYSTPSK